MGLTSEGLSNPVHCIWPSQGQLRTICPIMHDPEVECLLWKAAHCSEHHEASSLSPACLVSIFVRAYADVNSCVLPWLLFLKSKLMTGNASAVSFGIQFMLTVLHLRSWKLREVMKQLKYIQMLRPRTAAKQRKLKHANNGGPTDDCKE
ncbi:hypothetical protein OIU84_001033 [Salix udensis]|uniref:Uncharacterized protein n=1 Tax=Salix udensis TaxID=889485 RepID=A0AAD6PNU0_9ROSI|nr:hypothetical protein OIU84_001033 [Salix udensis]